MFNTGYAESEQRSRRWAAWKAWSRIDAAVQAEPVLGDVVFFHGWLAAVGDPAAY
jgi:hypothetical protein